MMAHEVASQLIFVSSMSFFARVSDPSIGGTYMTLLNTYYIHLIIRIIGDFIAIFFDNLVSRISG